ncbi:MAG: hypothetical protein NZL89_07370, partial [Leptospiraceae bacterium]|nr:hypothetical protein [Leptospiraceae bacterium]
MLMTPEEEQSARKVRDGDFFRKGIAGLLAQLVSRTWAEPVLLLKNELLHASAENALEPIARFLGSAVGWLTKPFFDAARKTSDHALEPTLQATRLAENLTKIYGEDYYVSEKKVVRRVYTCPFRDRPGA